MSDCDSEDDATDKQLKIVILGDSATGKTNIATRYTQDQFCRTHKPTVGVDFYLKRILVKGQINVVLHIWDLGGQSLGGNMLQNYIYGAQGILLVYDITDSLSFDNLYDWLSVVNSHGIQSGKTPPHLALIGNKADQLHLRTVSEERHNKFANEHDMSSHFLSAKTGESVLVCFQQVAAEMMGLKLTTADHELQQRVVTAQIENAESEIQASSSNTWNTSPRSPICLLQ